ncbi:MAG: uracil-DNA glycosylase [Candidatus Eremiobacteraeota bacterium]|nr:uracil-DNA glycosylase [Candidatus Eremiobacteraeota bacterium]
MDSSLEAIQRRIIGCTRCPELRTYCAQVARDKRRAYSAQDYWGKPVPAFGDEHARVMLVGLAPGAHGSNRTGRPFTGDASGDFLYPALHRAGFASQPFAHAVEDGMVLRDCIITAAARCAPPKNKPTPQQLRNCFPYLLEEFDAMPQLDVMIGLGKIGFDAILRALRERDFAFETSRPTFAHGAHHAATRAGRRITVLGTYHPSRQNTNTGKLTIPMFDAIFTSARALLTRE